MRVEPGDGGRMPDLHLGERCHRGLRRLLPSHPGVAGKQLADLPAHRPDRVGRGHGVLGDTAEQAGAHPPELTAVQADVSRPAMATRPVIAAELGSSRAAARASELLPLPVSPISATTWPAGTVRQASLTACTRPYRTFRSVTSRAGARSAGSAVTLPPWCADPRTSAAHQRPG